MHKSFHMNRSIEYSSSHHPKGPPPPTLGWVGVGVFEALANSKFALSPSLSLYIYNVITLYINHIYVTHIIITYIITL